MEDSLNLFNQPPPSFEAALQELEAIVRLLEGGGTSLEESLKAYERGVVLRHYCQETLSQSEQKIRVLEQQGAQGTLSDFTPPLAL